MCPDFHKFDKEKCHFNGKSFSVGQMIPDALLFWTCIESCECVRSDFEEIEIGCKSTIIQRPGHFFRQSTCISQYKNIQDCNNSHRICGK